MINNIKKLSHKLHKSMTKIIDHKKLHKVGKQWVVIGMSTLILLTGAFTLSTTTHASNINQNDSSVVTKANHSQNQTNQIQSKANSLHHDLLNKTTMIQLGARHHKARHLNVVKNRKHSNRINKHSHRKANKRTFKRNHKNLKAHKVTKRIRNKRNRKHVIKRHKRVNKVRKPIKRVRKNHKAKRNLKRRVSRKSHRATKHNKGLNFHGMHIINNSDIRDDNFDSDVTNDKTGALASESYKLLGQPTKQEVQEIQKLSDAHNETPQNKATDAQNEQEEKSDYSNDLSQRAMNQPKRSNYGSSDDYYNALANFDANNSTKQDFSDVMYPNLFAIAQDGSVDFNNITKDNRVLNNTYDSSFINDIRSDESQQGGKPNSRYELQQAINAFRDYVSSNNKMYKLGISDDFSSGEAPFPDAKYINSPSYRKGFNKYYHIGYKLMRNFDQE